MFKAIWFSGGGAQKTTFPLVCWEWFRECWVWAGELFFAASVPLAKFISSQSRMCVSRASVLKTSFFLFCLFDVDKSPKDRVGRKMEYGHERGGDVLSVGDSRARPGASGFDDLTGPPAGFQGAYRRHQSWVLMGPFYVFLSKGGRDSSSLIKLFGSLRKIYPDLHRRMSVTNRLVQHLFLS